MNPLSITLEANKSDVLSELVTVQGFSLVQGARLVTSHEYHGV